MMMLCISLKENLSVTLFKFKESIVSDLPRDCGTQLIINFILIIELDAGIVFRTQIGDPTPIIIDHEKNFLLEKKLHWNKKLFRSQLNDFLGCSFNLMDIFHSI